MSVAAAELVVVGRETWGAQHADGFGPADIPASEWWLHHSVTIAPDVLPPFDDEYRAMRQLEEIGQDRFGGGISYTWAVMPTGRIYEGHSWHRRGAHSKGHNRVGRAVVLVGDYSDHEPNDGQVEAVAQLLVAEWRLGHARSWRLNGPHSDIAKTACCGDGGRAAIGPINRRAHQLATGAQPTPRPPHRPAPRPPRKTPPFPLPAHHWFGPPAADPRQHSGHWRRDHAAIRTAQARLRERGWRIKVDGYYGVVTAGTVRAYQREKRLTVDGLVGQQTWRSLWSAPITR